MKLKDMEPRIMHAYYWVTHNAIKEGGNDFIDKVEILEK